MSEPDSTAFGRGTRTERASESDFTLTWPADPDASAYRVVRRADSLRVLARRGDGGWTTHVPDVVVMDEHLASQPQLTWPQADSAVAYRVVVRDDQLGEVVLRLGFAASPGRIDWGRLDASHPHRAQVQAWVDGEWREHVPYRKISGPHEQVEPGSLELDWPPAATAHDYRVSMWRDDPSTPVLEEKVAGPPVWVPTSTPIPGRRHYWRVQVRQRPGGSWETHLPPVILVDDELAGQPEVHWRANPGALAYRLLIRDLERDQMMSKDAFVSSPGRIDWSRLDVSHPHRMAIEAWVEGSWRPHVAARTLFPPPERILRPVAPPRDGRLRHVVVVRFPASLLDSAYGVQRPEALAVARLQLFESLTMPSLRLLQAWGVMWFVLPDPDVAAGVMASLRDLAGDRVLEPGGNAPVIQGAAGGIAIAWLTAGDGLHPGVPAAVERRARALFERRDPDTDTDIGRGGGADQPIRIEFPLCVEAGDDSACLARDRPAASFEVVVDPTDRPFEPLDRTPPTLRLQSLDAQVAEWGVAALLRVRPGPNEHPIFLRERGPEVRRDLLAVYGGDSAARGALANRSREQA